MALPASATRVLWESTCCVLRRRILIQPNLSKSSSKFSTREGPNRLTSRAQLAGATPDEGKRASATPTTLPSREIDPRL